MSVVVREIAEESIFKVGELAGRTGLSVRTLHHCDKIGLLSPSGRTGAGHRLYSAEDVLRLQQIRSLRSLGFGLEEIRALLENPELSPKKIIELHVSGLKEQIRARQLFLRQLEAVAERLETAEEVSAGELVDTAVEVIEMSESIEKYYTPEQLEYLADRRRELVEEFTGGDPGITRSRGNMWQQEQEIHGVDTRETQSMMQYVSKAMAAPGGRDPGWRPL